ncbi:xanthine dehydrogenase family protein subunit M [Lewinella sp. LCG006]|uniref:FAD binding domain-containing protein n=1 Tax=Lewinella sp. LCG006 TaxID=3231911 RepID=UPI0034615A47
MIAENFNYDSPSTLAEAFQLLHDYGDDAKILAGGHSLIPMMKLRFAAPTHLIDINNIPGLAYIKEEDGYLKIGAMTREADLEESDLIKAKYHIFGDATKLIADPQVRNFGTIGGNIAHGDAANDHPAVMIALDATVVISGQDGQREVSINDFFYGFYTTAVQHGEILTEIKIPAATGHFGSAYYKAERKVGDYATAGVAAVVQIDGNGVCTKAGIGLTNVNPLPMRAERSEAVLVGSKLTEEDIALAAKYAAEDCNPSDDLRGDEDYKRHLVKVITKRMLNQAIARAKK